MNGRSQTARHPRGGMRTARGLLCGAALALLPLLPQAARAQQTSSLGWARLPGAEACISTQALAERVEQRLGRRVFVSASQADLSLEGRVEHVARPEAFVANLVVSDRDGRVLGRRVLRAAGADCAALEPSLVLVIAIAIDPGASLASVLGPERALSGEAKAMLEQLELPKLSEQQLIDELTAPEAAPPPAPAAAASKAGTPGESAPRTPPIADDAPEGRIELRLSAGLTMAFGVLPRPALGAVLAATLGSAAFWPIDLWIEGLLEQAQTSVSGPGRGELGFVGGGLGLCPPLPGSQRFQPRACLGARGGALLARGRQFSESSMAANGGWFEPTLYGGVLWRLSAVSLHVSAGIGAPVIRDRFRYDDGLGSLRTLHRASAVTGHVELGAGTQF